MQFVANMPQIQRLYLHNADVKTVDINSIRGLNPDLYCFLGHFHVSFFFQLYNNSPLLSPFYCSVSQCSYLVGGGILYCVFAIFKYHYVSHMCLRSGNSYGCWLSYLAIGWWEIVVVLYGGSLRNWEQAHFIWAPWGEKKWMIILQLTKKTCSSGFASIVYTNFNVTRGIRIVQSI